MIALALTCLAFAVVPAVVYLRNLRLYRPSPAPAADRPGVSVLIPARNEEASIGPAVRAALASSGVELEVVVLDDQSEDGTRAAVEALARIDPRVRVESSAPLPSGWCGKQHACWTLAGLARYDLLVFIDADVRLEPAGVARLVAFLRSSGADLVSGVPRQVTGTILERLLIPLIHFLLLGFLPMWRMRRSRRPGFGAGCGQLFLATRSGYQAIGGHEAVRSSLHDGVTLPRAFRRAGRKTDLCDATDLASCRMYHDAGQVWTGLAKNAHEGIASPGLIVPFTIILAAGQVLPFALLVPLSLTDPLAGGLAAAGAVVAWWPRFDAVARFRQSPVGALLHPVGIAVFLVIQWYAFTRRAVGRPAAWKGRTYPAASRREPTPV
jgi:glycosyltransferase involved in cell wall biosynthesis